ncbi:M12 family metallopeptidase [Pedobacter sp. WC2501]|uniref:M12 family metallopeptidase n=1 Tax=Pedobacter sp. WC2501 TaxID=3461400 RepID=UPI00404679B1
MRKRHLTAVLLLLVASACKKNNDAEMQASEQASSSTAITTGDSIPHVCIDKFTGTEPIVMGKATEGTTTEMVYLGGTRWATGKTLRVFFINGNDFLHDKVMKYARIWSGVANIKFTVSNNMEYSDIRVGFRVNGDDRSWSYFGTDAEKSGKDKQTMNFGWFTWQTDERDFKGTITHEFGHAIGLAHEQLSPVEKINWDKPKVYKYYMGPPNNWTKKMVDDNIFNKYSASEVKNTVFDPKSIMQYPVPAEFTTDGVAIGYNYNLSTRDRVFIGNLYPGGGTPSGEPTDL